MSLFVVNSPDHDGTFTNLVSCHKTHPLVASAWDNPSTVLLTDSEGEKLCFIDLPNKELKVTMLAWHPSNKSLAIGMSNGKLLIWSAATPQSVGLEVSDPRCLLMTSKGGSCQDVEGAVREHNAGAIVCGAWSNGGQYFATATSQKNVAIWFIENATAVNDFGDRSRLMWSVETESVIHQMLPIPSSGADEIKFVLFNGGQKVFSLDGDQKLNTMLSQGERILALLVDSQTRAMILLNAKYMMEVYSIADDLTANLITHHKLTISSTPSESAPVSMIWASPTVVAVSCGDGFIRMFDTSSDEVFSVNFPDEGAHITSLSSVTGKALVAVATTEGVLAIFQRTATAVASMGNRRVSVTGAALGDKDPSLEWEAIATHDMGGRVDTVYCTPLGDIVSCINGKTLSVLHETIRKRDWDGTAAATQISSDMVVVESITGCQCLLQSPKKIRGLSISFPMIILWDGEQLNIFTINETTSAYSQVNSVPCSTPVFAAHPNGLLYVKEDRILYRSWDLQELGQLAFTEAEGFPMLLDVMCDYMVAVSNKSVLRLAKISALNLTPFGPSRPLNLSNATILSLKDGGDREQQRVNVSGPLTVVTARINAQGRKVALMTRVGSLGSPDSRIWIYDSDIDKAYCYDFAEQSEIPDTIYWNTPEPNSNSIGEMEYLLLACETHEVGGSGAQEVLESNTKQYKGGREPVRHHDLPQNLPDMQNYADGMNQRRRASLGATNLLIKRSHNIATLFATPNGLVLHNSITLQDYQICLVGLTIPDFLLASIKIKGDPSNAEDYVIEQKRLRDFDELKSDKDVAVREALLKFSYYATSNNMDEAYRCIKTIRNASAWQGLARMCVANGRLDVAAVCLATMQDGVGARLLREAIEEYPNDKNVQIATLACSLKMVEETEKYLRASQRYDLITDVYLACGKFEQAQRHTQRFDRIRIRPVAYKYAQFMESLQNNDAAIMWYYNSRCAGTDVPRVFFQTNRLHELRELMTSNPSEAAQSPQMYEDPKATFAGLFPQCKDLLLWWARYSERRYNAQEALHFFKQSNSIYDIVRILCSLNPPKIENALEVVNKEIERVTMKFDQYQSMATVPSDASDSKAEPERVGAAYFIGRHYEVNGDAEKALKYYKHAGAYRSGVRVARTEGRDKEMVQLAKSSRDDSLILECAIFLENKSTFDKAVELYREVGATQLALNACIRGGLYDTLNEISADLANSSTDSEVFMNMAKHFQSSGEYQRTVEMLVFAHHYDEALTMCQERGVTLTENMAEAMTKEHNGLRAEERQSLLKQVAHIAKEQGSWNLACKKYTQCGERVKALKMLMRGGEVEKVIFFANHSRNAEIYTLAANYLQSQSWSTDKNVYKSIVHFYTKAKAFDSLLSFFDSCAQLQIDENRDYKAALFAVNESIRTIEKAQSTNNHIANANVDLLKQKSTIISGLLRAQQLVDSIVAERRGTEEEKKKCDEVISICSDYVKRSRPAHEDHALLESAIRIGDVFALLVKFYFEKMGEPKNALKVLESMPKHGVEPQYFLEIDVMEQVCKANDKKLSDIVVINNATLPVAEGRRRSSAAGRSSILEEELKI
ncbi:hypothetical protein, conserved [Angomonas deanei]|uniref:Uncharacterized protein n=1 Tax=Angomonas deanei TaxID=59799 RepID=A0A7G2C9A2_9TRYP|nr:hypothetical protein, conserved [Angomonas deanei]